MVVYVKVLFCFSHLLVLFPQKFVFGFLCFFLFVVVVVVWPFSYMAFLTYLV